MRLCESCGFDSVPDDQNCPLCGSGVDARTELVDSAALRNALERDASANRKRLTVYPTGHLYASRYRIEAPVGRGGMGTVYKVTDTQDGRVLALKTLHRSVTDSEAGIGRFKREVTILSQLRHPAVPRVYEWGVEEDELYFVGDFISGRDLRAILREKGAWLAEDAARLVATVADALEAAHERQVIHRDLKPHNIMIADDGSVRLLDFGVARGAGIDMHTVTATGVVVGTPEYMSPEQFDSHRVDQRSDIYSLGVVLFELLTARLPFTADTPVGIAIKHQTEPPPSARAVRNDVPAWMDRLVTRCLQKDPALRFQTARDLAVELRRARKQAAPARRKLPTGDWVIEDESESTVWPLVLSSPNEKSGWTPGFALRFAERFYKLDRVDVDTQGKRWVYRFTFWPEEEIFRSMVDYDEDMAGRAKEGGSLKEKIAKLWK